MKLVHNENIIQLIDQLSNAVKNTANDLLILKEIVQDGETDDLDTMEIWDNNVYEINAAMFKQKMALMKVQTEVHRHVAHTLNPMKRTEPRGSKARKGKSAGLDALKKDSSNGLTIKRNKT